MSPRADPMAKSAILSGSPGATASVPGAARAIALIWAL
jgi:hypothetical protein